MTEKIFGSGLKVIFVPVFFVVPIGLDRRRRDALLVACRQTFASRRTSTSSRFESALTTETPTPWRPPETL